MLTGRGQRWLTTPSLLTYPFCLIHETIDRLVIHQIRDRRRTG
ncbi:hypothetical protein [Micromonospora sp. NPDC049891]